MVLKKDAQTCIDALYLHQWSDRGAQRSVDSPPYSPRSRLDSGPHSRGFLIHVSLFLAVELQLDCLDYLVNDCDWFRFFVVSILIFAE